MSGITFFTLHGGVNVIGGTKFHLTSGKDEIIFDFGATYEPGKGRFDHSLMVRPGRETDDYRATKMIPDLPYLYTYTPERHLAVFISHFHLDHVGMLHYLDPSVPVYMSKPSYELLEQLDTIGEGIGEHSDIRLFTYGKWIEFGNLQILPLPVEHDIPGSTGFYINTPDGSIAYTGDYRGHGLNPELTSAFFAKLGELSTHILLSEGTRSGEDPHLQILAEGDVGGVINRAIRPHNHVFFTVYNRNINRITTFGEAAHASGRQLVLTPATHHLFRTLAPQAYASTQPSVLVTQKHIVHGLPTWIADLEASRVTIRDIAQSPAQFLTELPYENLAELIDLRPVTGSIFIHSDGTPLGVFDPAFNNLKQWLQEFGLELIFARSSGHASPAYLSQCINLANPDILYPIHTANIAAMPAPPNGILAIPKLYQKYYL